jgi:aspartyl-tRNA(Asn)/glutamyl-tRNA(Gln) amidotransferase subunit A
MLHQQTAKALHEGFKSGKYSARQIAESYIKHTQDFEDQVGAYLSFEPESILAQADALDEKRARGDKLGLLAGVPIAIKDNIHINGTLTTCASKMLANYKALFDATVTKHLKHADAMLMGKTNMDEFAMGSSTEKSYFKPTRNPWHLKKVPGGSSGGSSAAVAARFAPLSLGSDTGGSIRQPAAFTGIVGYKPSYGRVSRHGLVAFASSLDQIGPFSLTVEDAYTTTQVIAGACDMDSTYMHKSFAPFETIRRHNLKGVKIGVPWHLVDSLDPVIKDNFIKSTESLKKLGAELVDINLDILKASIAVYYIIAPAEASTNLARYDGVRYGHRSPDAKTLDDVYYLSRQEGFGHEVKRRILLGTYVLSSGFQHAFYEKAQKVRKLVLEQFRQLFETLDLIAMPCTTTPAFDLGAFQNPLDMYLQDLYTIPANLAGLPAISVPSGFTPDGLPLGLQLQAASMNDELLLSCADVFERAHPEYLQMPKFIGLDN